MIVHVCIFNAIQNHFMNVCRFLKIHAFLIRYFQNIWGTSHFLCFFFFKKRYMKLSKICFLIVLKTFEKNSLAPASPLSCVCHLTRWVAFFRWASSVHLATGSHGCEGLDEERGRGGHTQTSKIFTLITILMGFKLEWPISV